MTKNSKHNVISKLFETKTSLFLKYILIVVFISLQFYVSGQNEITFINALKQTETTTLEVYLEDKIDFCIFEDQQVLSKRAAMLKLREFLSNNKITGAEVIHTGVSKNKSSQYKVVKITTSKDTYRMFVYASGEIGAKTIKEIRIDRF